MKLRDIKKPVLFLDFETTGTLDERLPYSHPSQPHILQVGWVLAVPGDGIESEGHFLVDANVPVLESATQRHRITRLRAAQFGIHPKAAMSCIYQLTKPAVLLCMYDTEQQFGALELAFDRLELRTHWAPIRGKNKVCVKDLACRYCQQSIPTDKVDGENADFRALSLDEMHRKILGYELQDPNHASDDVRGCWRIFEAIRMREVLEKAA